jgi:hypothetical protein
MLTIGGARAYGGLYGWTNNLKPPHTKVNHGIGGLLIYLHKTLGNSSTLKTLLQTTSHCKHDCQSMGNGIIVTLTSVVMC